MMEPKRLPMEIGCCRKCDRPRIDRAISEGRIPILTMIVCPICVNKRCPKASDHDLPCSGSNEPGQTGSVYGK